MKKISVLAIITLLLMAVEFVSTFVDIWGQTNPSTLIENRSEAVHDRIKKENHQGTKRALVLNVVPENEGLALDSVQNNRFNVQVPFAVRQVVVCGWMPWWIIIITAIFFLPTAPLTIWGMVCFIKLLISVFKQEVFTRKNARRLRIFVYTTYGLLALFSLCDWLMYHYVANQTVIPGYTIMGYEFAVSWSDTFLMFLIAEVFALGVKLQEDQELTI